MSHTVSFMSILYKKINENVHDKMLSLPKSKLNIFIFIFFYIMTTLTNSQGKVLTYTNEFVETILLQLNASNNYYTTGDDDILFIKIGSNKVLVLDYTYHIDRNVFQNCTINENTINDYNLEFILNNTSTPNPPTKSSRFWDLGATTLKSSA